MVSCTGRSRRAGRSCLRRCCTNTCNTQKERKKGGKGRGGEAGSVVVCERRSVLRFFIIHARSCTLCWGVGKTKPFGLLRTKHKWVRSPAVGGVPRKFSRGKFSKMRRTKVASRDTRCLLCLLLHSREVGHGSRKHVLVHGAELDAGLKQCNEKVEAQSRGGGGRSTVDLSFAARSRALRGGSSPGF